MASDRAYNPRRRPDIFYKGDRQSELELSSRAQERGQSLSPKPTTLSESVSDDIGLSMAGWLPESPKILRGRGGKNYIKSLGGNISNKVPISGTRIGKAQR